MKPFDANDYRKRVLAEVARRGGAGDSDPFELYDIPLEEAASITDADVSRRLDEVWAFWQKHRDHPKYRVLVGQLVAAHETISEPLRSSPRRVALAQRIAGEREQRDANRYELLDRAIERLVARHGGIPVSKRAGLDDVGAMGGLSPDEVALRVRRYRVLDDAQPAPSPPVTVELGSARLEQIEALLRELDRLSGDGSTPTLLSLVDLTLDDATDLTEIGVRAEQLNARSRQLPAGRLRAVIDELLVHIREVILDDVGMSRAYVASVISKVRAHLEPRIRVAILVEDEFRADDRQYMVEEAVSLGLGPVGARALVAEVAQACGAAVPAPQPPRRSRESDEVLRAARAALRAGKPVAAQQSCREAQTLTGGDPDVLREIRALSDEVEAVLAQARPRLQQALEDAAASRHVAALAGLSEVARIASDLDSADGSPRLDTALEASRRAVEAADIAVGRYDSRDAQSAAAIAAAARACVDHLELNRILERLTIPAPHYVRAIALPDGTTRVTWLPSGTPGVVYRVTRLMADGSSQTVGRTGATELVDGGVLPGNRAAIYEVTSILGGMRSDPARSDGAQAPVTEPAPGSPDITVHGFIDGRLRFDWPIGVTEVMVVVGGLAPPVDPTDPGGRATKVTNTRYEIDGGVLLPAGFGHVAVASCWRDERGILHTAPTFGPRARADERRTT